MRILIIGAGAVGGYFAARLIAAGRDVTLLVRPARAAQLRSTGLEVISVDGNVKVEPKLMLAEDLRSNPEPFDLVIVSTKAYSLDTAIDDFAPAVGPQTTILPLLNGMKHLDTLAARFGESAVVGGASRIFADLDAEGRIHLYSPVHDIIFGERSLKIPSRIQAIGAALQDCGFPATIVPDILAAMWTKWVMLSTVAATTCLLRGTIGSITAIPGGSQTAIAILAETAGIAAANGYTQQSGFLQEHTARITEPGSALTASMYRDLTKGLPVEVDHVLGDLLARGASHGVAAPLLTAAFVQVSIYSRSLSQ